MCNPTAEQKVNINSYKAQAETLLIFLRTQIETPEVKMAITAALLAISVYDQMLAGVCLAAEVISNANKSVEANKSLARAKMGYKR